MAANEFFGPDVQKPKLFFLERIVTVPSILLDIDTTVSFLFTLLFSPWLHFIGAVTKEYVVFLLRIEGFVSL